ncbi:hydroxymethylbilane synthase [Pseudonocardia spinosispora]|uniref:hydroxymethylbilane synthase n=1 Tax=Pseudonocardia spinosispora TaxID=103441 RepID=UPI000491C069|nr:hydroxymethylbilane synthase [Pseudonocardia spinosispora]
MIRIATRSSPMAVAQAEGVAAALEALDPGIGAELVKVTTAGDRWMGDLAKLGGKGAFIKEIDYALLEGRADLAMHCLKDVPGDIPVTDGLAFACFLPREDLRDAVITRSGAPLAELPEGSIVGTSSVRRAAQLRVHHPHLRVEPLRGNVNTRLMRLDEGHFDVLIAAVAGMERVEQTDRITEILPLDVMCPPIGAGIVTLQCRSDNTELLELCARLNDAETTRHAEAERAMLHALQGHCNSPIAGYATTDATGRLNLHGKVFSRDGSQWLDSHHWGVAEDPQALGFFVGSDLLRQGARAIIDAIAH